MPTSLRIVSAPGILLRLFARWKEVVNPEDLIIHLGDVYIGPKNCIAAVMDGLPGRKALILGNHDRNHSPTWWMEHGFDFACQGMKFRNCWLTHEPSTSLADGCELNIHGHLHNIWHGFHPDNGTVKVVHTKLRNPWQRLFSVEYTDYRPVEFDKFVSHPDKFQSRGPK